MLRERICCEDACNRAAVATLAATDFCVEHFLSRSYEHLSRQDPRNQGAGVDSFDPAQLRAFVDECSRSALEVSMHCETLDNLERARLLDILLWAGDLFLMLRTPPFCFHKGVFSKRGVIAEGAPLRAALR